MKDELRAALSRKVVEARFLLEEEVGQQLEGVYNILEDGTIKETAPGDPIVRTRLIELVEHFRATEPSTAAAVARARRELAFTTLNRFVALKLAEARGIVRECVSQGIDSVGVRELGDCAPGLRGAFEDEGYRLLLECVMDEISLEVGALFDRRAPAGLVWPRPRTVRRLLDILNDEALAPVWESDETIGWIYQYFNADDVKEMRDASSKGPRNSRELAVRNQFFTPRYVVRFLTDNTLGRLWYEMREGETEFREECAYLAARQDEVSGGGGKRTPKDPRDLRVLDPACGSGHFLLYCFDLLMTIYEEAWEASEFAWSASGQTLREDYPEREQLRRAVPALILHHNLYGIEIDPRCAQIASFALWLRAQRAWEEIGVAVSERPEIRRTHIVVAEPIPADEKLLQDFQADLRPVQLGHLFSEMIDQLRLAGDLGSLLRIERSIERSIQKARKEATQGTLFADEEGDPWSTAEESLLEGLHRYAAEVSNGGDGGGLRRRMFADDAEQGVALIDLLRARYDVVLMNPPFGAFTQATKPVAIEEFSETHHDIYAAFLERAFELINNGGWIGAITSSSFLKNRRLKGLREKWLIPHLKVLADLGPGVMDATVDAACTVLASRSGKRALFIDAKEASDKATALEPAELYESNKYDLELEVFSSLPHSVMLYSADLDLLKKSDSDTTIDPDLGEGRTGLRTFDNDRFIRLWWEVPSQVIGEGERWRYLAKGGDYQLFVRPLQCLIMWGEGGQELQAKNRMVNGQTAQARQGSSLYFKPGITYISRSKGFSPTVFPEGAIFSSNGPVIIPHSKCDPNFLLGLLCSSPVRAAVDAQAHRMSYSSGKLKRVRVPTLSDNEIQTIARASRETIRAKHGFFSMDETVPWFAGTPLPVGFSAVRSLADARDAVQRELGRVRAVTRESLTVINQALGAKDSANINEGDASIVSQFSDVSTRRVGEVILHFLVGCAFRRWEMARDPSEVMASSAFNSLADQMLPSVINGPDTMETDSGLREGTRGGGQRLDQEVERVADDLFPSWGDLKYEILGELDTADIRSFFHQPIKFFEWHLDLTSAHGRVAPFYWPLATASGDYIIWVYYPRLTSDTLYRAVSEHVEPKITSVDRRMTRLSHELEKGGERDRARLSSERSELEALKVELQDLREELLRVAELPYRPNLDDGVEINAAPLWRLLPHRQWQKRMKKTWKKLEEGEYDWSHMALTLWPDRVREACREDQSLAIAHDLEELYEGAS